MFMSRPWATGLIAMAVLTFNTAMAMALANPAGDANHDGSVDLADLKLLVAAWASSSQAGSSNWNPDCDFDNDGAIGLADLKILVAHWGAVLPVVNAGTDQTITLPAAALSGSATLNGLPDTSGTWTYAWSVDSGPGTVTFANASAATTKTTFSASGAYVLRLTVLDGELAGSDTVTITALPTPVVIDVRVDFSNAAPVTDANWNTINTTNATNQAMINFATGSTADGIAASVASVRGTIVRGTSTSNWQAGYPGPTWLDSNKNAAKDFFSEGSNSGMQLVFNGLDPALQYSVEVISSINSTSGYDNATSPWKVTGLTSTATTNFNAVTQGYQGGQCLTWTGISPDATGKIAVQVGTPGGNTPNLYFNAARLYYASGTSAAITSSSPLPAGLVGSAYNQTLMASGGATPYNWSIFSGSLPDGLTMSPDGVLAGTPTTPGASSFTVLVTDSSGVSNMKDFTLAVNQSPAITTQPQSQAVLVGQSLSLSVVATGLPAPSYQWQKNATNITGATGATLTINPAALTDAGDYDCVVTNVAGSIISDIATIRVDQANTAPVVNAGNNQTITLPTVASLSGWATDDGLPNPPAALTYTWSVDSGPGSVTFGDASAAGTTATFSVNGTYVLRLTASDSELSGSGTVTITADPAPQMTLNIEDFNNTPDASYTSYGGSKAPAGSAHLPGWDIGGRLFLFEAVNGDRMMTNTGSYSAFDLGIALTQVAADNEYEPAWDPAQASEAIALTNVDQLQFQFVSRAASTKTQGGDMNIYMYYYDASAGAPRTALVAVIPDATVWAPGEVKIATANMSSLAFDRTVDKVYGFRVFPNGGPGRCGLTSIAGYSGVFPTNRISIVRTGMTYPTLQSAANAAADGDTIEISSGTYVGYQVWAQINRNNITIRGVGPTRPVLDSNNNCLSSRGALLFDGDDCTLENVELCNARSGYVANAAGIRSEAINFTLRNCYIHDCDDGLLESNVHDSNILVEYTEFNHNGHGDGSTHNIYIGHCASLTLQYCYSHNCVVGHEVKTRARSNYILYNRLSDDGGNGSYEFSACNGGTTYVIGNQIWQSGPDGNMIILDYGSENTAQYQTPNPDQHLYVMNNTVINGLSNGGWWLRTQSDTIALVQNNIFQGPASTTWWGPKTLLNDWITTNAHLASPSTYDYHLTADSIGAINLGTVPDPATGIDGFSLIPVNQYVHPCNYVARPVDAAIDIGAYEYAN